MDDRKTILEVKNLSVDFKTGYGTVYAVQDVSFHVKEGEILGLVGESGSGKSVSMFAVMGLLSANANIKSEKIVFNGESIAHRDFDSVKSYEKKMCAIRGNSMAMIFQDPMTILNPVLTVGRQLREVILNHNPDIGLAEANRRTVELMHRVGISSPENRFSQYPFELSGGMRQSIVIAIALANKPKLIIADEPTTALDVTLQAQIMDLIREMREQTNASVVMIAHNPGVIAGLCDRINVMYGGRIVESGSTRDIFYSTGHPYTKGLLDCINDPGDNDKVLTPIPGSPPDMLKAPAGCPFADRCGEAMRICKSRMPDAEAISDTHSISCWLNEKKRREEEARNG